MKYIVQGPYISSANLYSKHELSHILTRSPQLISLSLKQFTHSLLVEVVNIEIYKPKKSQSRHICAFVLNVVHCNSQIYVL